MGNENSSSSEGKSYEKDYSSSYSSNIHHSTNTIDPSPKKPNNPTSDDPDVEDK